MQIRIRKYHWLSDWQVTNSKSDSKSKEHIGLIYILLMGIHTDTVILKKKFFF